jgi:4-hydroxy-2-oxoheptanedioate aldolase
MARPNKLRTIWQAGGWATNGWLSIPSSWSAELMAHQGWDSLTIDMQHGVIDYQVAVTMLQAISTTDVVPMARVPWNDPAMIMKLLDAGAYAIVCPMISTRAEAEAFVGACRYPPDGYRSLGPNRALLYSGADYAQHANRTVVTLAMIETKQGIENLEEIAATPGLDGLYIGPSDLSLALGLPPSMDPTDQRALDTIARIVATARKHKLVTGMFTGSAGQAARCAAQGIQLCTILNDARLLSGAAKEIVAAARAAAPAKPTGGSGGYA